MVDKNKKRDSMFGNKEVYNGIGILAFVFGLVHISFVYRRAEKNRFGKI